MFLARIIWVNFPHEGKTPPPNSNKMRYLDDDEREDHHDERNHSCRGVAMVVSHDDERW
jgi:hypothetical protein